MREIRSSGMEMIEESQTTSFLQILVLAQTFGLPVPYDLTSHAVYTDVQLSATTMYRGECWTIDGAVLSVDMIFFRIEWESDGAHSAYGSRQGHSTTTGKRRPSFQSKLYSDVLVQL